MDRWKVLVVDDQPEITANLKKQLSLAGFDVKLANNFTEANFLIEHYLFHIAILDILLPDGNGIDLYRQLRQKNEDLYAIMITGNATLENTITALNEGVNAYLIKPFQNDQLKAALLQAEKNLNLKIENQRLIQELQSNRQFYEDLLNSTSDAILVIDLDYQIQYCNKAAVKILKFSEDQLIHQPLHDFIDDGYKVLSHIYKQLALGKPVAGYRVGIKSEGDKIFDAHITADFLHNRNGHIEGLIVNLSSTMIHSELFNRMLRKERLSTIVNLANALGHEIRNPLNILYGRLQLLAEEITDENFDHAYQSIRRQIDRLLNITDLLSKFNFSREDSIPELFSITEILQRVLKSKMEQFRGKKIKIETHFEGGQCLVESNFTQFVDAFRYLLETILEYTPEKSKITINGKIVKHYHKGQTWELEFRIPNFQISAEQFFDPYQSSELNNNSLLGLGMTIMHTIFNNYGAKIEYNLHKDNSTSLRIRFPLSGKKSNKNTKEKRSIIESTKIKN